MENIQLGNSSADCNGGIRLYEILFISQTSPQHVVTHKLHLLFVIDFILEDVILNPDFSFMDDLAIP
jgi:hypothetical protein